MRRKGDVVRSIPSSPLSLAPLHFDIFRPAKLRLAAQKMIYAPGGVQGAMWNNRLSLRPFTTSTP